MSLPHPSGKQAMVPLLSAFSLDRMPTNFTRLTKMLAVLTEMLLPVPRLLVEKWRAQILTFRDIKFL
jgi:hypothetical protein